MKFLFVGLTFFLVTTSNFACTFSASETTLIMTKNKLQSFNIVDCKADQVERFTELLESSNGRISSSYINMLEGLKNIKIKPNHIRLRSLEDIVHTRLGLTNKQSVEFLPNTIDRDFLKLGDNEFLQASCNNCDKKGIKNILLKKSDGTKTEKAWVKARILHSITTYVSKRNANVNFAQLNVNDFEKKQVFVENPNEYLTDEDITYFRLNQNVLANTPIKKSYLSPLQLVKYGTPAKALFKKGNLKMEISAFPLSNGHIGESVKLKNAKTNKIFMGKIIGINRVKVEI